MKILMPWNKGYWEALTRTELNETIVNSLERNVLFTEPVNYPSVIGKMI